jgi:hypothetical protein
MSSLHSELSVFVASARSSRIDHDLMDEQRKHSARDNRISVCQKLEVSQNTAGAKF